MLTPDEHRAMELTAELTNLVVQNVIGTGTTRDQDVAEFVADVHRIQNRIMAQAAARAHPEQYRLLGYTIPKWADEESEGCGHGHENAIECGECIADAMAGYTADWHGVEAQEEVKDRL